MRILILGAGVLGCNLAKDLFRAGKDVTLLARGEWGESIRKNGLRVKNRYLPATKVSHVAVIDELSSADAYDVIFVVVRYTQIESVMDSLRENDTKNIVFVGNNVSAEKTAAALPGKNVMFAFSLSAGHREKDRAVSIDLKKITIGSLRGAPSNEGLVSEIFDGTGYKVVYEPNIGDYLLCHAAFVIPVAFACYLTDGDLRKIRKDDAYIDKIIDANIEGYRAIRNAGHAILPSADENFESAEYRKTCRRFFKLMCSTSLGKICASDHAMNAVDEMSGLNRDLKAFYEENGAEYPVWLSLEKDAEKYLRRSDG